MTRRQAICMAAARVGRHIFRQPFTVHYRSLREAGLSEPLHKLLLIIDDTMRVIVRVEQY